MITKYASFESSEVLDLKGSSSKIRTASLDKVADYDNYRTDDGYLYVRIRAISSRTNKNNDGWPSIELAGSPEIFDRHQSASGGFTVEASDGNADYGFKTFIGKPIFVDHNNSDPKKARGVIVDAKLNVLGDGKTSKVGDDYWDGPGADPEHLPPTEVELLLEVDAKSFPRFAKAIVDGDIDGFSMGCDVEHSKCSHCGKKASSPKEYCDHIQAKGASFDFVDSKSGKKTSKKSYENCYGIKFFEISGVFDPADQTAKTKEVVAAIHKEADLGEYNLDQLGKNGLPIDPIHLMHQPNPEIDMASHHNMFLKECPHCLGRGCANCEGTGELMAPFDPHAVGHDGQAVNHNMKEFLPEVHMPGPVRQGSTKLAENPEPQADHIKAPEQVDTLREEKVCPVCGSPDMENEKCDVCGYVEPPEGFGNPDLEKHQDFQQQLDANGGEMSAEQEPLAPGDLNPNQQEGSYLETRKTQTASITINDMKRWNPIVNGVEMRTAQTSDVENQTVASESAPVTSALRTARQMIEAAAKRNKENNMGKVAAPAPEAATPDKRVDVEGVGGVQDASNEQASKADKQVDVEGKGGVMQDSNQEASKADKQQSVGDRQEDNAGFQPGGQKGPHTQTWPNSNEPGSAVTDKAFPTSATHESDNNGPVDDGGQGPAKKGVEPVDPVGKADERVDVTQPVTSPANNSGKTDTWHGTDGNGVTKQQNPVTKTPTKSDGVTSHFIAAIKQADAEVELGLLDADQKYDRIAELNELSEEALQAEARVISRVKTAGLAKRSQTIESGATRLPSFKHAATHEVPVPDPVDNELLDAAVFSR